MALQCTALLNLRALGYDYFNENPANAVTLLAAVLCLHHALTSRLRQSKKIKNDFFEFV